MAVYQPSDKDNFLLESSPNNNYGSETALNVSDVSSAVRRSILYFDISAFSESYVHTAILSLYYYGKNGAYVNTEKTIWAYKLDNDSWSESESTWNEYSSGNSWTTAGGDYVTSNPAGASTTMPSGDNYGWVEFDISSIVQDAIDNESKHVNILVKFETETAAGTEDGNLQYFYSKEESTETTKRPKLTITELKKVSVSDSMSMSDSQTNKCIIPVSESITMTEIGPAVKRTANYQTKHDTTWTYQDKNG